MVNIAICDDNKEIRGGTEKLLLKYFIQRNLEYRTTKYESGEELLAEVEKYDLVFLDYEFGDKGENGLTIAKKIRAKKLDVTIIFLTSYSSIVFDAFEVSTFRFLVKPLVEEKLFAAMDDFYKTMEEDELLVIKKDGIKYFIRESQISYVEADGKNCIIHYINKGDIIKCNETLAAVEERISKKHFFRCHKSFLVNMRYVDSFSHTDLTLQNEEKIMISRHKYKPFSTAYANYIVQVAIG